MDPQRDRASNAIGEDAYSLNAVYRIFDECGRGNYGHFDMDVCRHWQKLQGKKFVEDQRRRCTWLERRKLGVIEILSGQNAWTGEFGGL